MHFVFRGRVEDLVLKGSIAPLNEELFMHRIDTIFALDHPHDYALIYGTRKIDPSLVGQMLQFGFANRASSFEPSGVFYDNVVTVLEAP